MTLILFFTRGVGLRDWVQTGMFDREKRIYERHLEEGNFSTIYWVTYGVDDRKLAAELKAKGRLHAGIQVLDKPACLDSKLGNFIFSLWLLIRHRAFLKAGDVFKTNQLDGSWSAVWAKRIFRKSLIVRSGYSASAFVKRRSSSRLKHGLFVAMERLAYRWADGSIVTSRHDKRYTQERYKVPAEKIFVVANYVDTDVFHPRETETFKNRLVFVGRLSEQKNLFNLISALAGTGLELDLYGKGDLQPALEAHAREKGVRVTFKGVVSNQELAQVLTRYEYYILPSFYEGMPKTLLEAMACGLICLATQTQGVDEVIEDGKDGYLIPGTEESRIRDAVRRAMTGDNRLVREAAVEKIRKFFSLETALAQEKMIFQKVCHE